MWRLCLCVSTYLPQQPDCLIDPVKEESFAKVREAVHVGFLIQSGTGTAFVRVLFYFSLPVSFHHCSMLLPVQSMWSVWWTKWHWSLFFFMYDLSCVSIIPSVLHPQFSPIQVGFLVDKVALEQVPLMYF